jgi:PAS domain S-box-containing protein
MTKEEIKNKAFLTAGGIFFGLVLVLTVVAFTFDFSSTNTQALSFILSLVVATLIALHFYNEIIRRETMVIEVAERVEETLRPSRLLFSEVYQNSPVAYVVTDATGMVISTNPAGLRLFGLPPEKMRDQQFFSLLNLNESHHVDIFLEKISNNVAISNEEISILQGQEIIWANLAVFPYVNDIGIRQLLITLVDMTKQKEVEVAKSEFVSLASHQLRTPITSMRWSAGLLLMDKANPLSPNQEKFTKRLLEAIDRMNALVDDFLQVSRFEFGTRTMKQEVVNLPQTFNDIMAEYELVAVGKQIKVIKKYALGRETFVTDPSLLRMIITNLYTNAVKYSKTGGEINFLATIEDGNLIIEVEDNGIGIPVAEQHRIFSKIFRSSNAMREVPDGTGLGLYIAKKAVEVMGGRISFVSEEGVGSTFTAVMPEQSL